MKTKAQGGGVSRGQARRRAATVRLSPLARGALAGDTPEGSVAGRTESAIRVYLGDKGSERPAWPYPGFLRGGEAEEDAGLELNVDPDLWLRFEAEAEKQRVPAQALLTHAAFYFAAELDAGRVTRRILRDLDAKAEGNDAS
jgi:hypothetical protein